MHRVAAFGDDTFIGEVAQDALELDAVGVLQAEGACNLARADLAIGIIADEGGDLFAAGNTLRRFAFRPAGAIISAALHGRPFL